MNADYAVGQRFMYLASPCGPVWSLQYINYYSVLKCIITLK